MGEDIRKVLSNEVKEELRYEKVTQEVEKKLAIKVNDILSEDIQKEEKKDTSKVKKEIMEDENEDYSDLTFKEIEYALKKEMEDILAIKEVNSWVDESATDEELERLNFMKDAQKERLIFLLEKATSILDEKTDYYSKPVMEFNITPDMFEDMEIYDKCVMALDDFYKQTGVDYKTYSPLYVEEIKKDIVEYKIFQSNIDNITYVNLRENLDIINNLTDRYPYSKKIIESSEKLLDNSSDLMNEKSIEISDILQTIDLTQKEQEYYEMQQEDNLFVEKMILQDPLASQYKNNIRKLELERNHITEKLETLDPDSQQYQSFKDKINSINSEIAEFTEEFSKRQEHFLNRKYQIDKFYEKNGQKIQEYEYLLYNLENLDAKIIELKEIQKEIPKEELVVETQEVNKVSNQENEIKESSIFDMTPESSKFMFEEFLKLNDEQKSEFLKNVKYDEMAYVSSLLKDEKNEFKLSSKGVKEIKAALNTEIGKILNPTDVRNKRNEITTLLNKTVNSTSKINNNKLFENLFSFDGKGVPFIADDLIASKDKNTLAVILEGYTLYLENGEIAEEEKEIFEKYIVTPLSMTVIKSNLNNIKTTNSILSILAGERDNSYDLIISKLTNLIKVKEQIRNNKSVVDTFGVGSVRTDEEMVAQKIAKSKNEKDYEHIGG